MSDKPTTAPAKKELCKLKISVTPDRGLEIYLQSNHNFSFLGVQNKDTYKIGGVDCWYPRNGDGAHLPGINGIFRVQKDCFQNDGLLNLSLLLARNLKEGVTFSFGTFPLSQEVVDNYARNFRDQVKMIYLTYMKEIFTSVIISTVTVETQEHD